MLHRPPIIFLDEPTSGVDPISRRQFWDLIHQMAADGVTVFVTTHYMDEAEYCNRLALIYRGKMVALGTPSELKQRFHEGRVAAGGVRGRSGRQSRPCSPPPGLLDAAVFGSALHLVVPQADSAIPRVQNFLAERGIAVGKIEKIRPSLEDVFVSLTTERGSRRPG